MQLVSHTIPVKTRQSDELLLMPIGDVQWAGDKKDVALGMLKRHIQWGVDHNAYFIGMGDYIDFLSPSNRARLRGAELYDTAMKVIDKKSEELTEELYDIALKPSKGKWLGLLEGHHYTQFESGVTTDQLLADRLQAPFLGTSAYIRLLFRRSTLPSVHQILIWAHHGVGGGGRVSAPLNKMDQLSINWDADIYLMGHHHKKVAAPIDYIVPVWPLRGGKPYLSHRTRIIANTGSFLRGYQEGAQHGKVPRGNYVEQKMLSPVSLGGIVITIKPRWRHRAGLEVWEPDLKVSL